MKFNEEAKGCLRDAVEIVAVIGAGFLVIWGLICGIVNAVDWFKDSMYLRSAEEPIEEAIVLEKGVGRVPTATRYKAYVLSEPEDTAIAYKEYMEGDGPAPEWYNPDEEMAVEWVDKFDVDWLDESDNFTDNEEIEEVIRMDIGCPDYDVETTLYGWDGHSMESWEMDMFSRIFYREFWQPNLTLCEAGCDAMLRLWEKSGGTMYESLSHVNENGSYSYSTYPGMWEDTYDLEGLEWCREFCEERFHQGPEWIAQYFRKGQYHDWGEWSPIPAYEIDGIYFSYK